MFCVWSLHDRPNIHVDLSSATFASSLSVLSMIWTVSESFLQVFMKDNLSSSIAKSNSIEITRSIVSYRYCFKIEFGVFS